jgi:23S rRNA (uracil1939-C5)-methyltransferase
MGKRRRENPVIEGLEITGLAAEGKAMGHHDGVVVFVPMTVPGDVVDVQVRSKRRRFMEAYVLRWVKRSPLRAEPFCEHFGVCGGCSWQNLPYAEQLRFKQQQVADQLSRIGRIELPAQGVRPILGSAKTAFYRNKLEFTFAPKRWLTREEMSASCAAIAAAESANRRSLGADEPGEEGTSERGGVYFENTASASDGVVRGDADSAADPDATATDATATAGPEPALGFHIPGMFDKILDIRKCWLQPDPSNAIRLEVKRFCLEQDWPFYDIRAHSGFMRNIVIRTASTGEVMVIVVFAEDDHRRIEALMVHLAAQFPEITSLMYMINTKLNDSTGDLDATLWAGRDHIVEEREGLRFKIGAKSFYQTNSEQAYELYKVARDFAGLADSGRNAGGGIKDGGLPVVYDLYTGTGTIANFVARGSSRVVGIEYVPEAIEDARMNSMLNGITNTVFYAGDMKRVLSDAFVAANGRPDVVILDPPRAGVDAPVIDVILRAAPQTIVYVSCNPATQARDLALMDAAYRVDAVQPVDMFPHTHHVENVVKLVRR